MRKVCVVTGTRAEYGLLSGLMNALQDSADFELQIIASSMHLSPEFGLTYKDIESDGFYIDAKVEMLLSGDSSVATCKSMGLGLISFSDAYQLLLPDIVIILGDRFEALVAAQAAMILKIPIAHLHGGEVTEGAVDESIRHAITKMSNIHFVATAEFRQRIIQMGELPERVIISGAPGIDNIKRITEVDKSAIEKNIGFELGETNFLVTYHPVTLASAAVDNSLDNLFAVLDSYPEAKIIITFPNADAEGRGIIKQLKAYSSANKGRVLLVESLGFTNYLRVLPHMDCVIGNSSSGLLEVPSFRVPTVNIGDRQKGRLRAESVIDCGTSAESIHAAIERALSDLYKKSIKHVKNPYGEGNAINIIVETLMNTDFSSLIRKPFYDIDFEVEQ